MTRLQLVFALLCGLLVLAAAAFAQVQMRQAGAPSRPYGRSEMAAAFSEIPMVTGDNLLLEVRINGKGPYRFLLDTGASGGGRISRVLAGSLGLKVVGQAVSGDPTGKNRQKIDIVQAATLTLGGATFSDVDLLSRDLVVPLGGKEAAFDGVLGIGLFQDYLLTLDFPARHVRLEKGELPPADGKEVLDFESRRGVPNIRVKVGELEVATDVDSGNMRGELVLPASYLGQVALEAEPKVAGRGRTGFNEFEIKQAPLREPVKIGGLILAHTTADFVEGFPHANLGQKFLSRFTVTIDQKNHRIRFRMPKPQAP